MPRIQQMCFLVTFLCAEYEGEEQSGRGKKVEKKAPEHQAKYIPRASSRRLKDGFPGNASYWLIYMDIKDPTGECF